MKLSNNFELSEFLFSETAYRYDIKEQFTPSKEVVDNLKLLCVNILQPVRDKFGAIKITSGYRCRKVNDIVKGSVTSQHKTGQASDIQALNTTNRVLFEYIKKSDLPFHQLIWEFGTKNNPAWVHVSFSGKPIRQVLYIGVK